MNKYTIEFFQYKDHIGAISDIENGNFLNDPKNTQQLGVVASVENIGLPTEVKDLIIKNHKREGGSFANTMLTKSNDGQMSIGMLSFHLHRVSDNDKTISIGRTCDLEVLDHCKVIENKPPQSFIDFIDKEFIG